MNHFFTDKNGVLFFLVHKSNVASHERSNIDAPFFTNRMMEKEPDRVCKLLDEYLCSVRDDSGIPIAVWTRARKKFPPKEDDDDDVENYVTQDA